MGRTEKLLVYFLVTALNASVLNTFSDLDENTPKIPRRHNQTNLGLLCDDDWLETVR